MSRLSLFLFIVAVATTLVPGSAQFTPTADFVPFPSIYFQFYPTNLNPGQDIRTLLNFVFSSSPSRFTATSEIIKDTNGTAAMVLCPRTVSTAALTGRSCDGAEWSSLGCVASMALSNTPGSSLPSTGSLDVTIAAHLLPLSSALFLVRCIDRSSGNDHDANNEVRWYVNLSFSDGGSPLDITQAPLALIYPILIGFSIITCCFIVITYHPVDRTSISLKWIVFSFFFFQVPFLASYTAGWTLLHTDARNLFTGMLIVFITQGFSLGMRFYMTISPIYPLWIWYKNFPSIRFISMPAIFSMLSLALALMLIQAYATLAGFLVVPWVVFSLAFVALILNLLYLFSLLRLSTNAQNPYEVLSQSDQSENYFSNDDQPIELQAITDTEPSNADDQAAAESIEEDDSPAQAEAPKPEPLPTLRQLSGVFVLFLSFIFLPILWGFLLPAVAPTFTWRWNWLQPLGDNFLFMIPPLIWIVAQPEFRSGFPERRKKPTLFHLTQRKNYANSVPA